MSKNKDKRKKQKEKVKRDLHGMRLALPSNKRHKTKKDFKRVTKVKLHEIAD